MQAHEETNREPRTSGHSVRLCSGGFAFNPHTAGARERQSVDAESRMAEMGHGGANRNTRRAGAERRRGDTRGPLGECAGRAWGGGDSAESLINPAAEQARSEQACGTRCPIIKVTSFP